AGYSRIVAALKRFRSGRGIRNHCRIGVILGPFLVRGEGHRCDRKVLEGSRHAGRLRQMPAEALPTLNEGFTPYELLHRLFGLHPGAATLTPTGRGGDCEFHAKLPRPRDREAEHLAPAWREISDTLGYQRRR